MKFNVNNCKVMHIGRQNEGKVYQMKECIGDDVLHKTMTEEKDLGIYITNDLKPFKQCQVAAAKATSAMRRLKNSLKHMDAGIFKKVYPGYVRTHMETSVQAWSPYFAKDIIS